MAEIGPYTPHVAVITGAAQGIGKATALRLADDGFDIAIADLPSKQEQLDQTVNEILRKGCKVIAVPTDVSKEHDVMFLIQRTVRELGGIDVMVANAGIFRLGTFLEMTEETYDLVMNVNAKGVMFCYKHAASQMIRQKRGGRIIGASSIVGKQGWYYVHSSMTGL
ncbi:hypothetical protein EIP91_002840 [Steccherinum ochraceum]|uniref:Uncharacterized protein n=1 Tax=Steccherinum ochraceum TaxID=92696 RepID=A0A4R0RN49_9APHY|nr:hypothetical protein EIP91_002840 [Steccherinum ochraceum]